MWGKCFFFFLREIKESKRESEREEDIWKCTEARLGRRGGEAT